MKRILKCSLFTLTLLSFSLTAQENINAQVKAGLLLPFNDFSESNFPGAKPDLFTTIGLGYTFPENYSLKGELTLGSLNGKVSHFFYETSIIEGYLAINYDLLGLITDTKLRIEAEAGAGILLYNAKMYNFNTRAILAESPSPSLKSLSMNPIVGLGGQLAYPLNHNIEINAGLGLKLVLFNDYMDAFNSGTSPDLYGNVFLGLTYKFGKKADPTKVEIDKTRYNAMISTIDSLEEKSSRLSPEQFAKLEMQSQEKDMKIRMLEQELDSAKANVVRVATDNTSPKVNTPSGANESAILATPLYRIIVASLPSRAMAQRWIDRTDLDKSGMVIAYVEDLNTYRIIYNSYETLAAAKKDLQPLKSVVPDAWVKKF